MKMGGRAIVSNSRFAARYYGFALAICLLGTTLGVGAASGKGGKQMNARQATALADQACRALAADDPTVHAEPASPVYGPQIEGWQVTCAEASGREVANLTWDAKTGEVIRVGAVVPETGKPLRVRTRQEAEKYALLWAQTLLQPARAQKQRQWRVVRIPRQRRAEWRVWLQGDDGRKVLVGLNGVSGGLRYMTRSTR